MGTKSYLPEGENTVVELRQKCNLIRSWNDSKVDIERKLRVNPELLLVGLIGSRVVATVIGGYDGHRGWIHYLAIDPTY